MPEHLWQWVGLMSGLLAIGMAVHKAWRLVRQGLVIAMPHDPDKPYLKPRLSLLDVGRGLAIVTAYARRFNPDIIVGINRGGAIVGGMLAKQLGKPAVYILEINFDKPETERVREHWPGVVTADSKLLLTDDAFRSGEHMRTAADYLRRTYPGIQIRSVVLLDIKGEFIGPEQHTGVRTPVECSAFRTYDARVKMPWDA